MIVGRMMEPKFAPKKPAINPIVKDEVSTDMRQELDELLLW